MGVGESGGGVVGGGQVWNDQERGGGEGYQN